MQEVRKNWWKNCKIKINPRIQEFGKFSTYAKVLKEIASGSVAQRES